MTMLLESAKSRYREIFNGLPLNDPNLKKRADETVGWAMRVLKRQDRIVWYLRFARFWMEFDLAHSNPDWVPKFNQRTSLLASKMGISSGALLNSLLGVHNSNARVISMLNHYMSMLHVPGIDQYQFGWQLPEKIEQDLKRLEQKWIEDQGDESQWIDHDQYADSDDREEDEWGLARDMQRSRISNPTILIDFPDGFAWWNLNRSYCEIEGEAMGHCGNAAAKDGTVLSLRYKQERPTKSGMKVMWRPVCTFILHGDGSLGEMKGRGNTKPAPKYHPYIVALLKSGYVKEIVGGGYAENENFSLEDLPDEQQEELIKSKPLLPGVKFWWDASGHNIQDQHVLGALKKSLMAINGSSLHYLIDAKRNSEGGYDYTIPMIKDDNGEDVIVLDDLGSTADVDFPDGDNQAYTGLQDLYKAIRDPDELDQYDWRKILDGMRPQTLRWMLKTARGRDIREASYRLGSGLVPELFHKINQNLPSRDDVQERLNRYIEYIVGSTYAVAEFASIIMGDRILAVIRPNSFVELVASLREQNNANSEHDSYLEGDGEKLQNLINDGWDAHTGDNDIYYMLQSMENNGLIGMSHMADPEWPDRQIEQPVDLKYGLFRGDWVSLYRDMLDEISQGRRFRLDQKDRHPDFIPVPDDKDGLSSMMRQPELDLDTGSVAGRDPRASVRYTDDIPVPKMGMDEDMDWLRRLAGIRS